MQLLLPVELVFKESFKVQSLLSQIAVEDAHIHHQLELELVVKSKSLNKVDLYFSPSLNRLEVAGAAQSAHRLFWGGLRRYFQCLAVDSCPIDELELHRVSLDRRYSHGESFILELHASLDNTLRRVEDDQWFNEQLAQKGPNGRIEMDNPFSAVFPFIVGPISQADYFVQQGESGLLLFSGNLLDQGEQWHIRREHQFLPIYLYFGDISVQRFEHGGISYVFSSLASRKEPSFRLHQKRELVSAVKAFFPESLAYPRRYMWIDYATNRSRTLSYAAPATMYINPRMWASESTLIQADIVVHEMIHQWTCTGLTRCWPKNYLVIESLTEYLTTRVLQDLGRFEKADIRSRRYRSFIETHESIRGLDATATNPDVYYFRNHSLFYRLEDLLGEEAFLAAIFDYLGDHYNQRSLVFMSDKGFIERLKARFPEHEGAIDFLMSTSEEFAFQVAGFEPVEQGVEYQIAVEHQEFIHGWTLDMAYSPRLQVRAELNGEPVATFECELDQEGCRLTVPTEVNHDCLVIDPFQMYFSLTPEYSRYCYQATSGA